MVVRVVAAPAVAVVAAEALHAAAVVAAVVADAEVRAAAEDRRRMVRGRNPGTTQYNSATPSTAGWSACSRCEPLVSQWRIP